LGAPAHAEAQRSPGRVVLVVGFLVAASLIPFVLRSRRGEPAMAVIIGSALGFGTSSIAIKLLSDGVNKGHYVVAFAWFAVVVAASGAAILSEMSALQLRPATVVVPISFAVQTFVPILLAPLFLEEHWSGADAVGGPLLGGLALILFASVTIARRPAVGRLFAGAGAVAPLRPTRAVEAEPVPRLRPTRRIAVAPRARSQAGAGAFRSGAEAEPETRPSQLRLAGLREPERRAPGVEASSHGDRARLEIGKSPPSGL